MRVGVRRETGDREFRVGMVPDGAAALVKQGHDVQVERGAGLGSGFSDDAYEQAGARIVDTERAWSEPDLVVKVKDPNEEEVQYLHPGQTLFTYLHLAAAPGLTAALRDADVYAIAYETVQNPDGSFPILAPMSEVAGRLAAQIGAHLLQQDAGGKGLLLGGVPGVARGRVTILGGGTVGINALRVAHGALAPPCLAARTLRSRWPSPVSRRCTAAAAARCTAGSRARRCASPRRAARWR